MYLLDLDNNNNKNNIIKIIIIIIIIISVYGHVFTDGGLCA